MRISDWSSDVCSSDLIVADRRERLRIGAQPAGADAEQVAHWTLPPPEPAPPLVATRARNCASTIEAMPNWRSDAKIGRAPSELQSLMRISYAVFCLKQKSTKRAHDSPRVRQSSV